MHIWAEASLKKNIYIYGLKVIVTAQSIKVSSHFRSWYYIQNAENLCTYTLLSKNRPVLFMKILISCRHFYMSLSLNFNDIIFRIASMLVPKMLLGCGMQLRNGLQCVFSQWPAGLYFHCLQFYISALESCFCHIQIYWNWFMHFLFFV